MEETNEKAIKTDYGIEEYVPEEARHYTFKDMVSTWMVANGNTTSWFVGSVIAAIGFVSSIWAVVIGNFVVYFFLALVGYMGYKIGTSTMGLSRVPFGIRGSKVPSLISAIQFFGWCSVNAYIAGISLTYMLKHFISVPAYGEVGGNLTMAIAVVVIMLVTSILAIYGGSKAIGIAQNISVVALIILTVWITVVSLKTYPLSEIIAWRSDGSTGMTFGLAMDSISALGIAWILSMADFTRYTNTKNAATIAPFIGSFIGKLWFCGVGIISVIAVAINTGVFNPDLADPASVATALGLGQIANVLIILSTIAVNLISLYSGGYAAANFVGDGDTDPKKAMAGVAIISTLLAFIPLFAGGFLALLQVFLGLLGALLPPFVAILVVDFFLLRDQDYDISKISEENGPYWYKNGINWTAMICWVAGTISYFISLRISFIANNIGGVLGCFLVTGILYYIFGKQHIVKAATT